MRQNPLVMIPLALGPPALPFGPPAPPHGAAEAPPPRLRSGALVGGGRDKLDAVVLEKA